ncbi:MAG: hypothetical protein OEW87_01510 [Flavobacteriaceae bacterium]|nr:hypothetical protein [Flavobacteriaceae bacterium]
MDQLEILKKDWKKQESSLPKLSREDLSKLMYKKSSSIVKWIFIISVLEFMLPHIIYLFIDYDKVIQQYKELDLYNFSLISNIIFYAVVLVFIYLFYKNYRSISANSQPKVLMQNIMKTRKTVKYYIWFNLGMIPVIAGVTLFKTFNSSEFTDKVPENISMVLVWLISIILILALVVLFWLFYRLIYGILLNKLEKNYNELVSNDTDLS